MSPDILVSLILLSLFVSLGIVTTAVLFGSKAWFRNQYRLSAAIHKSFESYLAGGPLPVLQEATFTTYLNVYTRLRDEVEIPEELAKHVAEAIRDRALDVRWIADLRHRKRSVRLRSVTRLSLLGRAAIEPVFVERIKTETSPLVLMRIAHELARANAIEAIPAIVDTIGREKTWYRHRIIQILLVFGNSLLQYILERLERGDEAVLPLALAFGRHFLNKTILEHIIAVAGGEGPYAVEAMEVLSWRYPDRTQSKEFFGHPNPAIRGLAWATLARKADKETLLRLVEAADDQAVSTRISGAIADIARRAPNLLPVLLEAFRKEDDAAGGRRTARSEVLADILVSRLGYFIYGRYPIDRLVAFMVESERLAALDSFFAGNKSPEIEAILVECLSRVLHGRETPRQALATILPPDILAKLGIEASPPPQRRSFLRLSAAEKTWLWILAAALVFLPPVLYAIAFHIPAETPVALLRRYTVSYSRFFAFYSVTLNSLYLGLLVLSIVNVARQFRIWGNTSTSLLFTDRMLPTVSIIVPAYREETTIVDSVQSMVSINYPQFEVIVVCDGSPDATLERVIEAFDMKKSGSDLPAGIFPTAPIHGVYRSDKHPYLILLDKANGGKADALNAGINFARHDYLCCVDADSLLGNDALLKMMYQVVASDREIIACGGNIMPVNGCSVKRGSIERIALPAKPLTRFQTVEYLRSFLAGRLGWAQLNSLLVISGAFGVFRRDRVLEIGGYLTGEGTGHFDTVGEDMEIVVRLARHMRTKKIKYRIGYAFNANCWTEVPEDWTTLWRQRDRWQRGLIEILLYHRRSLFKPRYGTLGLLSLPYFWLFELIGPFLEALGWTSAILAMAMGTMDPHLALLIFVSTIAFGIVISMGSIAIGEFHILYYSWRETLKLLLFSILENFGFRQIMSFSRVTAYFSTLLGRGGWGTMKRRGFMKAAGRR